MRLLVLGNDKICRALMRDIELPIDVKPVRDHSSANLRRILKLVRRRAVSPIQIAQMALAEITRPAAPEFSADEISSSTELLDLAHRLKPDCIILFRAGLIIRKDLLATRIPIWNVHSARLPEYGGLASICRALRDGSFEQSATLHVVTERIDKGEVLDTEPYRLDPTKSYAANERLAYAAGARLLERTLRVTQTILT